MGANRVVITPWLAYRIGPHTMIITDRQTALIVRLTFTREQIQEFAEDAIDQFLTYGSACLYRMDGSLGDVLVVVDHPVYAKIPEHSIVAIPEPDEDTSGTKNAEDIPGVRALLGEWGVER